MIQPFLWLLRYKGNNSILSCLSAVSVFPSSFDIRSYIIENHQSLGCDNNTTLFVIAAGIRPVKNPLFLVNAFAGNNIMVIKQNYRLCRPIKIVINEAWNTIRWYWWNGHEKLRVILIFFPSFLIGKNKTCKINVKKCYCFGFGMGLNFST